MKTNFFKFFTAFLLFSSCSKSFERNQKNPFYDQSYCNSTMIDNDDYCSDRLYPKHKQPPILINKPKDDSKKDSKGQPEVRSESNNSKSNEGREENSRDFGTSSRGRGD